MRYEITFVLIFILCVDLLSHPVLAYKLSVVRVGDTRQKDHNRYICVIFQVDKSLILTH